MTYMATPQHKNPCIGGRDIYNLGRIFLGHHYYTLNLSEPCPGVKKKIFLKKCINITLFTPKLPTLGVSGVIKFTISTFLSLQMLLTKFVKIDPGVLERKMLTDDGRRKMTDANPKQQVTSDDLNSESFDLNC